MQIGNILHQGHQLLTYCFHILFFTYIPGLRDYIDIISAGTIYPLQFSLHIFMRQNYQALTLHTIFLSLISILNNRDDHF